MSFGRPNLPRIETDNSEHPSQEYRFSLDTTSPFTPTGSQTLGVPFRLSTSTNDGGTPNELLKPIKPLSTDRARDERRKLLAHVLTQLRTRVMPPSVSDAIGTFHDEINHSWNFKDVMKTQIGKLQQHGDGDSDDESQDYSSDFTFDLMVQLQEILVMSLEQRWDIFDGSGLSQKPLFSQESTSKLSSPFRRSRSSFYNTRGKSRSPSPTRKNEVYASELLTLCISVLASVIAEDCRFQTNLPRPSRPPNALQVVTLNVAQVLLHINARDARTISQIGLALVPAFSTFNKEMYPRIISFFDQGIIRNSLSSLRRLQGFGTNQSAVDDSVNHPLVSIHVDEVTEDKLQANDKPIWRPWTSTGRTLKIQSTNAPAQPISIYYLSSIVPPLLGCILDNIELESLDEKDLQTLGILQKLLQSIVDLKVDAYSDILQVVAYHTPKARKFAVTLLSSFWPRSVGHVVISQPPTNLPSTLIGNIPREHQFTPWQFRHRHNWFSPGDSSQFDCTACRKAIHGFGLLCPQCTCGVHFDCYDLPDGNALIQCTNVSDPHVQRVAMFRFSKTFVDSSSPWNTKSLNPGGHEFHRINLFTLSLCCACHQPLWGCTSQCLRCGACSQFVHPHCLDSRIPGPCGSMVTDSASLTIELSPLRLSCYEHYRDILGLSYPDLKNKSYEEISIFRDILSTQLQILEHGLALGAFLVTHKGKNIDHKHKGIPEFELHRTLRHCEDLLAVDGLAASPGIEEYLQENSLLRRDHSMLYTWSSLIYVVTAMKSPSTALGPSNTASSDFLNVAQVGIHPDAAADEISHPFDMVSLAHMRDVLGHEFRVHSDAAVYVLLSHLHHLALFSSTEAVVLDLPTMQGNKNQSCSFPLPLGLDLSIDVETLVSAIEGCLSDVDLFVNEFGFLLLTRRMWPDGLMSDYGLKRLARGVFTWIISEDSQLAVILRDYLGKNQPLPGVASNLTNQWPPVHHERRTHGGPMQNSGDYLASRQALLDQYAKRWLLALHNQDADLYARSLFNTCDELADHRAATNIRVLEHHTVTEGDRLMQCERILHHILRLLQARVLFSVSDAIYLQWLELVHSYGTLEKDVSSSTLLKLLTRDSDHRATTMIMSTTGEFTDRSTGLDTDPWRVIVDISRESPSGLEKGLRWLSLLSRSGIDVPLNIYNQFIATLGSAESSLNSSCSFIKSVFASLWLRPLGRQQYQRMLAEFYRSLVPGIHEAFQKSSSQQNAIAVIRYTFASCLLMYGCERTELVSVGLVEDELISSLPSRRKLTKEAVLVEPVLVDAALMETIDLHLKAKNGDITSTIARFLHVLFTSPSFMEAHEMDNFILRNEYLLSHCAWQFYDVQQPEIAKLRISVLLRVLSVDPEEFKALLEQRLAHNQEWEVRASCATRLFRIIQDVCSPAFNVDGRQWKSSIVNVFQCFFSLLWTDPKEEIRLVTKAHCFSLLPAHLGAITSCFDETVTRAPISDRIKLVSFLTHLRVHFPTWRVLSWDALLEVLAENPDYDHRLYSDIDNVRSQGTIAGGDPELARLNVSLAVLALDMLSDGIDADCLNLIKIKAQLVRILGFQNVSIIPAGTNGHWFHLVYGELKSISELAYPCFGGLVSLLDSWNKTELPSPVITTNSHDDKKVEVLIGTLFADIPINLLATYERLLELPVLAIKDLLEAVHVIIYKHDFENRNLNVFSSPVLRRAIAQTLDLLEVDVPYEVRQVALSVVQAFFKKSTTITSPFILKVTEKVLKLVAAQASHSTQDSLVEQGCSFVGDTFEKYCKTGLFINLLKHPLSKEIFLALRNVLDRPKSSSPTLRDDLLWDTFLKLQETEGSLLQSLLDNLQHFIELVHHEHYSAEMMSLVGKQLIHLAQRMSDGSGSAVDASPLFNIAATLLHHNKVYSKDLLPYIDTLTRITLARLQVDRESISHLLIATASLRRKSQPQDPASVINTIIPTVFEILGDGLRLKIRLPAITLRSALEAIVTTELSPTVTPVTLHSHLLVGLAEGGGYWLDNYYWVEGQTEQDFHASLAVARMIFQAMSYGASVLEMPSESFEKSARPRLRSLRAWNILAMVALSGNADSSWAAQLFKQLKTFSVVYSNSLWPYIKSIGPVPDSATADINHAYIAMKLWLMVAGRSEEARQLGEPVYNSVWDEFWPAFESIVSVLEAEAQTGISPIMTGFIASSIADLFLFTGSLRITPSLQKLAQRTMLKRLQNLVQRESVMMKLNRVMEGLVETPPETPLETLVDQAAKDIIATEKLRLLEANHEPSRVVGDRRANMEKKTTVDRLNWKDVKLPYT